MIEREELSELKAKAFHESFGVLKMSADDNNKHRY